MQRRPIAEVLAEHADWLMGFPGVVGVAHAPSGAAPAILVMVAGGKADLLQLLPASVEGYPLLVEETGEFQARGVPPDVR
ncbi:MAG: hypothetical protein HY532_02665 [Chloroflexi bacterium]|nr:hypothetical protein [Chloroflexota bacterium]